MTRLKKQLRIRIIDRIKLNIQFNFPHSHVGTLSMDEVSDFALDDIFGSNHSLVLILYQSILIDVVRCNYMPLAISDIPFYVQSLVSQLVNFEQSDIHLIYVTPFIESQSNNHTLSTILQTFFTFHQSPTFLYTHFDQSNHLMKAQLRPMWQLVPINVFLQPNPYSVSCIQNIFAHYNLHKILIYSHSLDEAFNSIIQICSNHSFNAVAFIHCKRETGTLEAAIIINRFGMLQSGVFRYHDTLTNSPLPTLDFVSNQDVSVSLHGYPHMLYPDSNHQSPC